MHSWQQLFRWGNGQQSLLALSKADHVLAIIDPVTLEIKARIPVGQDPHEVIVSPDGEQPM